MVLFPLSQTILLSGRITFLIFPTDERLNIATGSGSFSLVSYKEAYRNAAKIVIAAALLIQFQGNDKSICFTFRACGIWLSRRDIIIALREALSSCERLL